MRKILLLFFVLIIVSACSKTGNNTGTGTNTSSYNIYLRITNMSELYAVTNGMGNSSDPQFTYNDNNAGLPSGYAENSWYPCSAGIYNYSFTYSFVETHLYLQPDNTISGTASGSYQLLNGVDGDVYYSLDATEPWDRLQGYQLCNGTFSQSNTLGYPGFPLGTPGVLFIMKIIQGNIIDLTKPVSYLRITNTGSQMWNDMPNLPYLINPNQYYPLPQLDTAVYGIGPQGGYWFYGFATEKDKNRYYTLKMGSSYLTDTLTYSYTQ